MKRNAFWEKIGFLDNSLIGNSFVTVHRNAIYHSNTIHILKCIS